jgi:hypothetical protein
LVFVVVLVKGAADQQLPGKPCSAKCLRSNAFISQAPRALSPAARPGARSTHFKGGAFYRPSARGFHYRPSSAARPPQNHGPASRRPRPSAESAPLSQPLYCLSPLFGEGDKGGRRRRRIKALERRHLGDNQQGLPEDAEGGASEIPCRACRITPRHPVYAVFFVVS